MEPKENKFQQLEKESRLINFQERVFCNEEKVVNNNHRQKMNTNENPTMSELKTGSQGEIVKDAQRILKSTLDYIGYVDGDFGEITKAAVQSFQRRSKLPITGIIDRETWEALKKRRS